LSKKSRFHEYFQEEVFIYESGYPVLRLLDSLSAIIFQTLREDSENLEENKEDLEEDIEGLREDKDELQEYKDELKKDKYELEDDKST
jgi:septal ring factor EnvC (AmiA/AmiB activator)